MVRRVCVCARCSSAGREWAVIVPACAGDLEEEFLRREDVQVVLLEYDEDMRSDAAAEAEQLAEAAEEAARIAHDELVRATRKRYEAEWVAFYAAYPSAVLGRHTLTLQ